MIQFNLLIMALAALVPLVTGFIWYNPKVFGNTWMRASGIRPEEGRQANMAKVFGITYLLSLMLTMAVSTLVIHQMHFFSTLANEPSLKDPNSDLSLYAKDFMNRFGHNFRTFKHGALHGTMSGLFIVMPVIGILSLFERKGFKYVAVHTGYWMLTLALMGGIICQFLRMS